MDWPEIISLFDRYGVSMSLVICGVLALGWFGVMLRRAVVWFGTRIVEPLKDRHLTFLNALEKSTNEQAATSARIQAGVDAVQLALANDRESREMHMGEMRAAFAEQRTMRDTLGALAKEAARAAAIAAEAAAEAAAATVRARELRAAKEQQQ